MLHEHIGWAAVDAEGKPHRTHRRAGWDRKAGLNPPRVYATEGTAKGQSPVKKAARVFMEVPDGD